MVTNVRVIGRNYYSSARPTHASPSLPISTASMLQNVTPESMLKQVVDDLQMQRSGERFDLHPAVQLSQRFPAQKSSLFSGKNRVILDELSFDWETTLRTRSPQSIVMCPPTHYFEETVNYAINKWMKRGMPVSREMAQLQWEALMASIRTVMPVDEMKPMEDCPDMVFVDQGLALPVPGSNENVFIPSFMKCAERRLEVGIARDFFKSRGYTLRELTDILPKTAVPTFEANGDAHVVPERGLLFVGHGGRTSTDVLLPLEALTGHAIIPLHMEQHQGAYHLDTASCLIDENTAIVYPEGFNPNSLALFFLFFKAVYIVNDYEAANDFIPNSKQIGRIFFTQRSVNENFLRFLNGQFEEGDKEVLEFDMSEFNKSGGGINCCSKLTFHIPPDGGE